MKRLFYIVLLFLLGGCNDSDMFAGILEQKPETVKSSENMWQKEEQFEAASRELHARFRNCFNNVIRRSYRDRAKIFDYMSQTYQNVCDNKLEINWSKESPNIDWQMEYDIISTANQIIHYVRDAPIPEDRRNFFLSEAVIVRGWVYLYLVQNWENVPLLVDAFDNGLKAATPGKDVLIYIIKSVKEVLPLMRPLSELYDAKGNLITNKQIPCLGTGHTLLSDLCAWTGSLYDDPELLREALNYADLVINSGEYEMVPTSHEIITKVLKGNSIESIWEWNFFDIENETNNYGSSTAYAAEMYPVIPNATEKSKRRTYRLSFEKAKADFNTCGTLFDEIFYNTPEMEKLPTTTTQGAIYIWKIRDILTHQEGEQTGMIRAFNTNEIIYRLPDVILLRAELKYKLGDLQGAESDLNLIRKRCGAALYSPGEGDLLEAIISQCVQEFFLEGIDKRMHTIMRNGLPMIRKMLTGRFRTAESMTEVYFPISVMAFFRNPLLRQNPYWNNYIQFRIN